MDGFYIFIIAGVLSFLGFKIKPKNIDKVNKIHGLQFVDGKRRENITSEDLLKTNLGVSSVKELKYKEVKKARSGSSRFLFANPKTNKQQLQQINFETEQVESAWNPANQNYENPWPNEETREFSYLKNLDKRQKKKDKEKIWNAEREKLKNSSSLQKQRSTSEAIKNSMLENLNINYEGWEDVE